MDSLELLFLLNALFFCPPHPACPPVCNLSLPPGSKSLYPGFRCLTLALPCSSVPTHCDNCVRNRWGKKNWFKSGKHKIGDCCSVVTCDFFFQSFIILDVHIGKYQTGFKEEDDLNPKCDLVRLHFLGQLTETVPLVVNSVGQMALLEKPEPLVSTQLHNRFENESFFPFLFFSLQG